MVYADYEWYIKEDLSNYSGKRLAIVNEEIVASGANLQKVLDESQKKYPKQRPFVTKIRAKLQVL